MGSGRIHHCDIRLCLPADQRSPVSAPQQGYLILLPLGPLQAIRLVLDRAGIASDQEVVITQGLVEAEIARLEAELGIVRGVDVPIDGVEIEGLR